MGGGGSAPAARGQRQTRMPHHRRGRHLAPAVYDARAGRATEHLRPRRLRRGRGARRSFPDGWEFGQRAPRAHRQRRAAKGGEGYGRGHWPGHPAGAHGRIVPVVGIAHLGASNSYGFRREAESSLNF
ncbi:hypothetical protein G6F50_016635 [Rhizopus delemar]|uniref:Uncharacterized protein n=1 Tax=Rhizopus delemar TaxID=936053 RepID=A0A9P6XSD2_9FUNG|nr:hypothetical protein G6F50_016635 [Rhizopus delemar]